MKRVLLVDSNEDFLWMLQRNLSKSLPQLDFFAVTSGKEALQALQERNVDLVITALEMAGMNGIDLLHKIQNSNPNTRVITITSDTNPDEANEAILNGALRTISKNLNFQEIANIINAALEENEHFQGTIDGVELIDIVQLNGLSGVTAALKVHTSSEEGVIFFQNGEIVHAICEEKSGKEALFAILRFGGGSLQNIRGTEAPAITIEQDLQSLLLQATLQSDEESQIIAPSKNNQTPSSPQEEEPMNNITIKEILAEFTAIDGVHTACLVGRDGFLLDSIARAGIDAEMIGAIASSGFGSAESMGNQLGQGELTMTMLEYENGPVMFAPVGTEAFLVIVADQDTNLGWIRISIKKNSKKIEDAANL